MLRKTLIVAGFVVGGLLLASIALSTADSGHRCRICNSKMEKLKTVTVSDGVNKTRPVADLTSYYCAECEETYIEQEAPTILNTK